MIWPLSAHPDHGLAGRLSEAIAAPIYPGNAYGSLDVSPIPPPEWLVPQTVAVSGN